MALCAALRLHLRSPSVFYSLESFDRLFLQSLRYKCTIARLDSPRDHISKSLIQFLLCYLLRYKTLAADSIHYACRVLNIPVYHIFREFKPFMLQKNFVLQTACCSIVALQLCPKPDEQLCRSYVARHFYPFNLVHGATVVSPSYFFKFTLHMTHLVICDLMGKGASGTTDVQVHISMKSAFINLYSMCCDCGGGGNVSAGNGKRAAKKMSHHHHHHHQQQRHPGGKSRSSSSSTCCCDSSKKKWSPVITRTSYYYFTINKIKTSYVITFNHVMRKLHPFVPVKVAAVSAAFLDDTQCSNQIPVTEHAHYTRVSSMLALKLTKLVGKVTDCEYLWRLRRPGTTPTVSGWRSPSSRERFRMPDLEIMADQQVILFVPSIVLHGNTPARVPKRDQILNKRYAWQISKFVGLTSSGYSMREDPSGHVYSINIAGGENNGRAKVLLLNSMHFNSKHNSLVPNQQVHTDVKPRPGRREFIWTHVRLNLSNQCKSDHNFLAGVTDLTHRVKLIQKKWPRYRKKRSFPVVQRMAEHTKNDDLLIHKGTVLSRISTVDSEIRHSIEEMIKETKMVADYCPSLTALNFVMEHDHMMQFPPYVIYMSKLLFYKYRDVELVRRKMSTLLLSRRIYAQNGSWCTSLSMPTEDLWKMSSVKLDNKQVDYRPKMRDNRLLIERFTNFFKQVTPNGSTIKGDDLPDSLMNREVYRFKYIPDPSIFLLTAPKEACFTCPYYQYVYDIYRCFIDDNGGREHFPDTYRVFDAIDAHRAEHGQQHQQQQQQQQQ